MPEAKTPAQSYTEQVQIIMAGQINGSSRLFGGQLVEWMDVVAGVAARRHSNRNVTTACIDRLIFREPAFVNDTMVITGKVTYVGTSSMEVKVEAFTEHLSGERNLINTAYFILVALDENGRPVKVPPLEPVTDEEKAEYQAGEQRQKQRKSENLAKK